MAFPLQITLITGTSAYGVTVQTGNLDFSKVQTALKPKYSQPSIIHAKERERIFSKQQMIKIISFGCGEVPYAIYNRAAKFSLVAFCSD